MPTRLQLLDTSVQVGDVHTTERNHQRLLRIAGRPPVDNKAAPHVVGLLESRDPPVILVHPQRSFRIAVAEQRQGVTLPLRGLPAILGGGDWFGHFLEPSFHLEAVHEVAEHASVEGTLMAVSSAIAIAGILIAAYFFLQNQRAADAIATRFGGLYRLLLNKYYVDEIYDATIVQPIRIVSQEGLWKGIDVNVIDRSVNGVGDIVRGSSGVLRLVQTGSVRTYAASLFLGVVLILGYYLWF